MSTENVDLTMKIAIKNKTTSTELIYHSDRAYNTDFHYIKPNWKDPTPDYQ